MICKQCGKEFEPKKRGRKNTGFCSKKCSDKWHYERKPKYILFCPECKKIFYSNRKGQKYCSQSCAQDARRTGRTVHRKVCLYCGTEFETVYPDRKYCTSTCASRHAGDKRRGEYFCEYCGKPRFSDHPNRNRFCSMDCAVKAKHIEVLKRNAEKEQKRLELLQPRICDYCDATFLPSTSNQRFCSADCSYKWRLERNRKINLESYVPTIVNCPICGKSFATSLWAKNKQYCSKECGEKAAHERAKEVRREQMQRAFVERVGLNTIFKAYRGFCAICGLPVPETTEPSNQWAATVDHIIPLSKGGLHEKRNCQLAHRLCNSIKLDTEKAYRIDWTQKLKDEPGRWNQQMDDLWNQLGVELIESA